ncbi:MAG: hypothetical protein Q4A19_01295 [Johnsonella sp.]|nr:hypothetical protein [Johnsonella sp.]
MKIINKKIKTGLEWIVVILLCISLCGCRDTHASPGVDNIGETNKEENGMIETKEQEPYVVKTVLKENSVVDPDTGTGIYTRYTELTAADDAPETFKKVIAECNRRAEEAARRRMLSVPSELSVKTLQEKSKDYRFETYAYIVTITRADHVAFSILETEYESGLWDAAKEREVSYRFRGSTFDTSSGEEFPLSALASDEKNLSEMLEKTLKTQYGTSELAGTEPSNYSWTADALGIRFYFNSDAVSKEKRREIGDYSNDVITVALPYDILGGATVGKLSEVPEAYIARIDRETVYKLPYGDLSIMLTKNDAETLIRMMPDQMPETSLRIEYADASSDFYIIRSRGGFYLFREEMFDEAGFFYDFSRPDGGYGRFKYYPSQYFDSFMREIRLALPYNPYCAHMCEVRRSFGKTRSDASSFVPNGHYSFSDDTNSIYKRFALIDDALRIDTRNTACRLLEDMSAEEIDAQGQKLSDIKIKAGAAIVFESVSGEADRYQDTYRRSGQEVSYIYKGRLADGRRIRIHSVTEDEISVNGTYLSRVSEPVSLAEAQIDITPPEAEVFTVHIGSKDYKLIPDYSKIDHIGEEIDFGDDIWWLKEGYVGRYEMTDEDIADMKDSGLISSSNVDKGGVLLQIGKDGKVRFDYYGMAYEGTMPDKRYYGKSVVVALKFKYEFRTFDIILRNGRSHDVPSRIQFYSKGLPATNEPSKQPPITVYLTKIE